VPDAAGQTGPTTTGAPKAPFGRLIVTGLAGTQLDEATRQALAKGRIGGIILMGTNVASVDQVRQLTSDVRQAASQAPKSFKPIICIDQEGGTVDRLRALPLENRIPSARELAAKPDALPGVAQAVGHYLKDMGINVDLAPVLDLDVPPYNPVVGTRSFGAAPQSVARLGRLFVQGLDSAGVRSVGKHFPGHGAVSEDSHTVLPTSHCSTEDLQRDHIAPFRELIEDRTLGAVMTAHVVYTALDRERPATLSRQVVTALLREELGFDGVVFTDSLAMGAVASSGSLGKVAVESWAAGCDVVLTTDGAWVADGILEEGQQALDEGPLSVEQVERSCKRVDRWLADGAAGRH
jgi:beta-N-acetylhexosaminidase